MIKKFLLLSFLTCLYLSINAQVKIACVGNSITYGAGIENRETKSYPAQLQQILGENYLVKNFGVSGATLLKKGDKPYWQEPKFSAAIEFNPDIVIIKLGTNDSKPQNWQFGANFKEDYIALIDTFMKVKKNMTFFLVEPVPAFAMCWGIRDSVITAGVIPVVTEIAKMENLYLIDLYTPFLEKGAFFPDKIHPDARGAKLMAEMIAEHIKKYSLTIN